MQLRHQPFTNKRSFCAPAAPIIKTKLDETVAAEPIGEFARRVQRREARIAIIGLGYVGLPLALRLSGEGFPVTGIDVDVSKVNALNSGRSYIARISGQEVASMSARGFRATTTFDSLADHDAIIICVPTPLGRQREPDLGYIQAAAQSIAPNIRPGHLIVLESTSYPGTTEEILLPLLEAGNTTGLCATGEPPIGRFYIAYSPEREDPGNREFKPKAIPKIVSGCDRHALEMTRVLYESFYTEVVCVSSPRVAEMTKLLENIYRCVNIALVNELKQLSHRMNIDIFEVINAAKTKPFGFQAFYPGPGLGGHCIPIDPFYLSWKARQYDFDTRFIELAGEVNNSMPKYVVARTAEALNARSKPLKGASILILGVAYKRDIDDARESPSLAIIDLLLARGAHVAYHDPFCQTIISKSASAPVMSVASLDDLDVYDCVLIATDHSQYDYSGIVKKAKLVIDTRNATKGIASDNVVHC